MKLAIDHYLSVLRERDELEILLRNLLVVDQYTVIKKASRGMREFGVDVAAYKRQSDGYHLYLFQVKAGDLDRITWNVGENSVRTGLTEAIDKPFDTFAEMPSAPVLVHLIIVFNGYEKDDVVGLFNGFVRDETRARPNIRISKWNQSVLTSKVEKSLLNEGLVPSVDALTLKKALAFADVPHYPFDELKALLGNLTSRTTSRTAVRIRRLFSTARVINKMIATYARNGGTHTNAVISTEITILHLAAWCEARDVRGPTAKKMVEVLLEDYALELTSLMQKLQPLITQKHGLFLGGTSELLEYPLRTFEILGFAAIYALLSMHLGMENQRWATQLVNRIIVNNPSSHRPLLDNHLVPICLAALVNMFDFEPTNAAHYAIRVLENLAIRQRLERPLPELRNDLDALVEAIASGKIPANYVGDSSTIIPMLFEFLLLMDEEQGAQNYSDYREEFTTVNLQCWYPPEDYEKEIFSQEIGGGLAETSIKLPPSFSAFREETAARHERFSKDWPDDAFSTKLNGFVLYIAFRHFRTPVFPHLWRAFIFRRGGP